MSQVKILLYEGEVMDHAEELLRRDPGVIGLRAGARVESLEPVEGDDGKTDHYVVTVEINDSPD